jgi:hypothetical protein
VHTTGSYLDMKYTKQKGVLMEEMFDEIRAWLEHSYRKSLAWLATQEQLLKTSARSATEKLTSMAI